MKKCLSTLLLLLAVWSAAAQGIIDFHPAKEVLPRLRTARKAAVEENSIQSMPASWTALQFSDIHGSVENLERIVTFRNAYSDYLDAAIHLGDAVYCYADDMNPWYQVQGAEYLMNVVGNHDCWKGHKTWSQTDMPYDATQEETYNSFIGLFIGHWKVIQPDGIYDHNSPDYCACYYYKDYPASSLRLIALDAIHYGSAQHRWFVSVLADAAQKGYAVIAAQHYPAQSGIVPINCGFSDMDLTIDAVATPQKGGQMSRMPKEAFAAVDSFIDNGGQFVCWLSGHTHLDYIGLVKGHERQLQVMVDKAGEVDQYMQEDRTHGTRFQDSFNLVTVNPSRKILVIDRIGCDRDQYLRSKKLFVYNYAERRVLATE